MLDIYDIVFVSFYSIIHFILYGITYQWIDHMEKTGCECSKDWRRDFIRYYIIFAISYNIISVLYLIFIGKNIDIALNVRIMILFIDIFFIINAYLYITKLKNDKCECSDSIYREITLIHTIISGCLIFISFSIIIFINLSLYISSKYKKNSIS